VFLCKREVRVRYQVIQTCCFLIKIWNRSSDHLARRFTRLSNALPVRNSNGFKMRIKKNYGYWETYLIFQVSQASLRYAPAPRRFDHPATRSDRDLPSNWRVPGRSASLLSSRCGTRFLGNSDLPAGEEAREQVHRQVMWPSAPPETNRDRLEPSMRPRKNPRAKTRYGQINTHFAAKTTQNRHSHNTLKGLHFPDRQPVGKLYSCDRSRKSMQHPEFK
jgi:hypothetical protein